MKKREHSGRIQNTKRNIGYGLLQVIVSQLLPFVVRTILIYRFGVSYLGLNSLFTSVLSVLSLMELGFGTAVVYSLYKPMGAGDTDQVCAWLRYYRTIYRRIGLAILTVGLMLLPFLRYLIHDTSLAGELNLPVCYLIFLADTVISYLLYGYLTSIPTADQRRDLLSRVDMGMNLLSCAVKSMLLLCSSNFYLYLVSIPAVTVIRNVVTAKVIQRQYPEYTCRGEILSDQKQDLNRRVRGLVIEKVTAVSRNSIDTLCISSLLGLAAAGMYNNYFYVMSGVISFSSIVLNGMMASVGNSIAVESREKNYSDMRLFDFMYTGIAGWAAVCMLCLYQPFVKTWLGDQMMLGWPVVAGLSAYFYILKSGDIRWVYHEGAGLWYESRFIMIGEAAVNLLLNVLLCRTMGVFGIVLATVISVFVTNAFFCPRLLFDLYFQNGKLKEYWKDHALYTLTMLVTAGVCLGMCESLLPMSMVDGREAVSCILCLGGRFVLCSAVSVFSFWMIWRKSGRYGRAKEWMRVLMGM